jgi:hypothetical protein
MGLQDCFAATLINQTAEDRWKALPNYQDPWVEQWHLIEQDALQKLAASGILNPIEQRRFFVDYAYEHGAQNLTVATMFSSLILGPLRPEEFNGRPFDAKMVQAYYEIGEYADFIESRSFFVINLALVCFGCPESNIGSTRYMANRTAVGGRGVAWINLERAVLESELFIGVAGDAIGGFSYSEAMVIRETYDILISKAITKLRAAYKAGEAVTVRIGGRTIQYKPGLPASGFSLPDGFALGPEAFATEEELTKTILHELYRVTVRPKGIAINGAYATAETTGAADFAERGARALCRSN